MASRRGNGSFQPLVLCYHGVSSSWGRSLAVTPEAFEHRIRRLLRSGLRPVSAAEVISGRGKVFHVTFDDAFANIVPSLGVLSTLGVPATVFAVSGFAETGRPFDAGRLGRLEPTPELDAHRRTMTWDELRAIAQQGFEIGSHTETHPHLTRLDDDDLARELQASRERVEAEIGAPCAWLAYPFGDYDARVMAATRSAGYSAGFALAAPIGNFSPYAIPRVGLYRSDGRGRSALKVSALGRRLVAARGARAMSAD
jgi:peptidoglycan/xylan/chitin deacetylase (PgdA/CDA1 family)